MAEEIAFENDRISNFEGLVTWTLDRVILHTLVHHSSTSGSKDNHCSEAESHTAYKVDDLYGTTDDLLSTL